VTISGVGDEPGHPFRVVDIERGSPKEQRWPFLVLPQQASSN